MTVPKPISDPIYLDDEGPDTLRDHQPVQVSTGVYLGGTAACACFGAAVVGALASRGEQVEAKLYVVLATAASLQVVLLMTLLFRLGSAIQDGRAKLTPRQILLRCLVPGYNVFWAFRKAGVAADYNAYLERHHLPARPLDPRLFKVCVVFWLLSLVPFVRSLALLAAAAATLLAVARICEALNALGSIEVVPPKGALRAARFTVGRSQSIQEPAPESARRIRMAEL